MSFLGTKILQRMNNTLYPETEQHYQKRVFSVFFTLLSNNTPKCIQSPLYGPTKHHYQKRVLWVFWNVLGIKTLKTCLFGVFEFLSYENTKTRAKHTIWKKRITLQKQVFWVFLSLLRRKTPKSKQKTLYGKRKGHSERDVYFFFFLHS